MKRWWMPLMLSSVAAWASPQLELEVGGGTAIRTEFAPSLSARVGVDLWERFTPSLKVLTLGQLGGDHTSWATLAEFRAHTSGTFQLSAAVGVGFGDARLETSTHGLDAQFFQATPYLSGDVGARATVGRFWVGVNVGGMPFERLLLATLNVGVAPFGG